jgi:hypothetical protein
MSTASQGPSAVAANNLVPALMLLLTGVFIVMVGAGSCNLQPPTKEPDPKPAPAPSLENPLSNRYTVLVKSCKSQAEARAVIIRLHDKRIPNLEPIPQNGNLLVCSGKFYNEEDANGRLSLLKSNDFSDAVVLKPKK